VSVNFTYSDSNLNSCWWSDNNGITNISNPSCLNLTGSWVEGVNNIIVYANDTAGNVNSSRVTFTIDTIAPIITITNPTGADVNSNNILLSVTTNEITNCDYSLDGLANASFTEKNSTHFSQEISTITNGNHHIFVYCNDSIGWKNYTNVSFYAYLVPTSSDGVVGATSGAEAPIGQVVFVNYSTTSDLYNFSINYSNWFYERDNEIFVTPYMKNGTITSLTNLTFKILTGNITYITGNLTRSVSGVYRKEFFVKDNTPTYLNMSVTASQNNISITKVQQIPITKISKSEYAKFKMKKWINSFFVYIEKNWRWCLLALAILIILIASLIIIKRQHKRSRKS